MHTKTYEHVIQTRISARRLRWSITSRTNVGSPLPRCQEIRANESRRLVKIFGVERYVVKNLSTHDTTFNHGTQPHTVHTRTPLIYGDLCLPASTPIHTAHGRWAPFVPLPTSTSRRAHPCFTQSKPNTKIAGQYLHAHRPTFNQHVYPNTQRSAGYVREPLADENIYSSAPSFFHIAHERQCPCASLSESTCQ